jgi:orotidine-5'-phosphate decarboxylase
MNSQCGLLVNSSRGIIYASQKNDFADAAAYQAKKLQKEMQVILKLKGLI